MANRSRKPVPTTTDALDVAMEMAGDQDAARTLLADHSRLIAAQIRSERLEHRNKLAMIAFRSILAAGALALILGFGWMVMNARNDRGLVIEALSVPPDLAQRGLTGQTMAAALADKLAEIDRTARSFRSTQTMTVNWGNDVKIQIPETGVSIGEVDAYLRRMLGHQTVIGGAAYRSPEGLKLTVRVGGSGAIDQTGKDSDLDAMLQKAAEGVFAQTQAYRYSKYLEFKGRRDEAMAVARQIIATSDERNERAWAWAQVSNLLGMTDSAGAIRAARRGMRENPENPLNYINGAVAASHLRNERLTALWIHRANRLGLRPKNGLSEVGVNQSRLNMAFEAGTDRGDVQDVIRQLNAVQGPTFYADRGDDDGQDRSVALALHDVGGVLANPAPQPDAAFAKTFADNNGVVAPQYDTAMLVEDYPRAIALTRDLMAVYATNPQSPHLSAVGRDRFLLPYLALALAKNGQIAEAQRLAAAFPADCEGCSIVTAQIAVVAGQYDVARKIVTQAIARAPYPLFPTLGLAQIEQRAGRYAAALAAADRVVAIGPNFADGHKARGDALRRLGRIDEAVSEYRKTAKIAPRWTRLYIDWAIAEIERGDKATARGKLDKTRWLYQLPSEKRAIAAVSRLAA